MSCTFRVKWKLHLRCALLCRLWLVQAHKLCTCAHTSPAAHPVLCIVWFTYVCVHFGIRVFASNLFAMCLTLKDILYDWNDNVCYALRAAAPCTQIWVTAGSANGLLNVETWLSTTCALTFHDGVSHTVGSCLVNITVSIVEVSRSVHLNWYRH